MAKYRPALDSLAANTFVNDPSRSELDRIYLRGIQATWKIKLNDAPNNRHSFQMMLVWDYDRIWGSFDLGDFKGLLMVDHGPQSDPWEEQGSDEEEDDEPVYFDFTWRGYRKAEPDILHINPLLTKGRIEFRTTTISGFFEAMGGPQANPVAFEGQLERGPRRVARSLESFIDEWNEMSPAFSDEFESPRMAPTIPARRGNVGSAAQGRHAGDDDDEKDEGDDDDESMDEDEEEDDDEEDEDSEEDEEMEDVDNDSTGGVGVGQFLQSLNGAYNITSDTVEEGWPDKAQGLELRLQYDAAQKKTWGHFDLGVWEGFMRRESSKGKFAYGQSLLFDYRSRDAETGENVRGKVAVELSNSRRVTGSFDDLYGPEVSFEGKRKQMPSGKSGQDVSFYRNGWKE